MPDGREPIQIKVLNTLADVAAEQWDACAGPENPFLSHAFLGALEASGSVCADTGWLPRHLAVEDEDGRLAAVAPLYLKNHSYGEYVFDWAWADAYHRAGGEYYPKLLSAVPFTPVTGPRLLLAPDAGPEHRKLLIGAMVRLAGQLGVSSLHVTFPAEDDWRLCGEMGLLRRIGRQFHWENKGYGSFDDFLDRLTSRKRKAIRRERRAVADSGVRVRALAGAEIEEEHWNAFYRFYNNTTNIKWGNKYLNRAFFSALHRAMADRVVLVMAEANGAYVGGALNLAGTDTLYGRYWGCTEEYKFLHFEACYYQAIDYAIRHGLKWVEAGAQGPHKIQRGYLPRETYSAHWIADDRFRGVIADFLERERSEVEYEMDELAQGSPYREEKD